MMLPKKLITECDKDHVKRRENLVKNEKVSLNGTKPKVALPEGS
jgi:hypothetical protein